MKKQLVNVLYYEHNSKDIRVKQENGYVFTLPIGATIIATKEHGGYRLSEYRSGALIGHSDKLKHAKQAAMTLLNKVSNDLEAFDALVDRHIEHYGRQNI